MDPNVDRRNWLTLQARLKRAADVLRHVFLNRWKVIHDGRQWTNGKDTGEEFISGIGSAAYRQATGPQKTLLEAGDVTQWDITTTAMVLRTATFSEKGDTDYKRQIEDENKMVEQVTNVRNQVKHLESLTVSNEVFDKLWAEMIQVLVALGKCKDELDIMKNAEDLDSIRFNRDLENQANNAAATTLKDTGNQFFKEGKWLQAIASYNEALLFKDFSAQTRATILSNRSAAYLRLIADQNSSPSKPGAAKDIKDFQYRALYDAKEAVSLWPTWWRAYYRTGLAYIAMNKMEKAIRQLDISLALEPTKSEVLVARDYARLKLGQQNGGTPTPGLGSNPDATPNGDARGLKETLRQVAIIGGAAFCVGKLFVLAAPVVLAGVGFGSAGVVGGSIAAGIHSMIGNVAAGSLFAACQSAGAAGLAATTSASIGATGGAVGALAGAGVAKLTAKSDEPPPRSDSSNGDSRRRGT